MKPIFPNVSEEVNQFSHSVVMQFKSFPAKDIGLVTNEFKRNLLDYTQQQPIEKIIKDLATGKPAILASVEMMTKNFAVDQKELNNQTFRFLQSSIFVIKVEDQHGLIPPDEVILALKDEIVGIVLTEQHRANINHNYYVVFQTSKTITKGTDMRELARLYKDRLIDRFPRWPAGTVKDLSPTHVIVGGKDFEINNSISFVNVNSLLPLIQNAQLTRESNKRAWLKASGKKATYFPEFKELKRIALHIGNIQQDPSLWAKIITSIKNHELYGKDLSESEGLELFRILSNANEGDSTYIRWGAQGQSTVATLLEHAQRVGCILEEYSNVLGGNATIDLPTEHIKINQFLSAEDVRGILKSKLKILLDSPTGSGKTTALLTACKEFSKLDEQMYFYLFAVPTTFLVDQLSHKHGILGVQGGMNQIGKMINNRIQIGERCFITTYDKAKDTIHYIQQSAGFQANFTLIVDEVHKTVYDYNYRTKALDSLFSLFNLAETVVGVSGTPDDVLHSMFDKRVFVENGNRKSPCRDFVTYQYSGEKSKASQKKALQQVLLERANAGFKLLVFIQNKKYVKEINDWLVSNGIKSDFLDSQTKQGETYQYIKEKACFPPGVNVIISTSVAADGLSIENKTNYECIIVHTSFSVLSNPSLIKQMSNRFRNPYKRFSLFMEKSEELGVRPLNIDKTFNVHIRRANNLVQEQSVEFEGLHHLYAITSLEEHYGITVTPEGVWHINKYLLRHRASVVKERYYAKHRVALQQEMERLIGNKPKVIPVTSENILSDAASSEGTSTYTQISEIFTFDIYQSYVKGNQQSIVAFEKQIRRWHMEILPMLISDTDCYETCLKLLSHITNYTTKAQLVYRLNNLPKILITRQFQRKDTTAKICSAISEVDKQLVSDEWEFELNRIAKLFDLHYDNVLSTSREYFIPKSKKTTRNGKSVHVKRLDLLSVDNMMSTYGLSRYELQKILYNRSKMEPQGRREKLHQAIEAILV